ncbi:hypothetical protein FGADI_11983 [Fusarium gaditjirri]|uniref:Uncharacterized protein n=1 Tax=Fusarium gaditjirri TaxID=282569 RepID=A0A8H4ST58_9HYPO|nr:hypothetical protein FGADI_11983 [Fusarium gaditjirri]
MAAHLLSLEVFHRATDGKSAALGLQSLVVMVHNYGAGGTGFQAGYGMALDAVRAAESILSRLPTELKSKL